MDTADVLVVGLGAMGSATAYHLAKLGASVIGIDRFHPPHQQGSSSGDTRITRLAVGEGDAYVPLALRSHELWPEIEAETGENILTTCGALVLSGSGTGGAVHGTGDFVPATADVADRFGIAHELLAAAEIAARYPQLRLGPDFTGYYEPSGGFLRAGAAIRGQLTLAARRGADLRYGEEVVAIAETGAGVEVRTGTGSYLADQAVVSAGAWLPTFLPGSVLADRFRIYRQVMFWFDTEAAAEFTPDKFPVFLWPFGDGEFFYGFPALDGESGGVKVATDSFSAATSAAAVDRTVTGEEARRMHAHCIEGRIPALSNRPVRHSVCMFTVAPRFGFVIDRHPVLSRVWLVSACSGHGFKHSAAIGEAVAQRTLGGRSTISLSPFSLETLDG